MSDDDTEPQPFSSSVFSTPPSYNLQMSRKSLYRGGPYDSWTILGNGMPNFQEFTPNEPRAKDRSLASFEVDPMVSARERVHDRRRRCCSDAAYSRQKLIFFVVLALTVFFPPAGLLAMYGKFDSTVSWYTHGELHGLTGEQRGTLKQQLLVEMVLYPALIITLAVYYSVHE